MVGRNKLSSAQFRQSLQSDVIFAPAGTAQYLGSGFFHSAASPYALTLSGLAARSFHSQNQRKRASLLLFGKPWASAQRLITFARPRRHY